MDYSQLERDAEHLAEVANAFKSKISALRLESDAGSSRDSSTKSKDETITVRYTK